MLKNKRILGIILAVMFALSVLPASFAQTYGGVDFDRIDAIERIESMLSNAAQYPEQFGIDFGENIELGVEFNVYRLDSSLYKIDDVKYYPVLSDSKVVAIVEIYGNFSQPSISFGKDFADELQVFLDNNEEFALIYEGGKLYAVSESQKVLLREYYFNQIETRRAQPVLDLQDILSSIELSEIVPLCDLEISDSGFQTFAAPSSYSLNVPVKLQYYWQLCWAASIASIGQYMTGINKTPEAVADSAGLSYYGGQPPEVSSREYYLQYRLSTSIVNSAPSYSTIMNNISSGKPIHGGFSNSKGNHAVVISGYNSGSYFSFTYMDPNFGFKTVSSYADGVYEINVVDLGTMLCKTHIKLS